MAMTTQTVCEEAGASKSLNNAVVPRCPSPSSSSSSSSSPSPLLVVKNNMLSMTLRYEEMHHAIDAHAMSLNNLVTLSVFCTYPEETTTFDESSTSSHSVASSADSNNNSSYSSPYSSFIDRIRPPLSSQLNRIAHLSDNFQHHHHHAPDEEAAAAAAAAAAASKHRQQSSSTLTTPAPTSMEHSEFFPDLSYRVTQRRRSNNSSSPVTIITEPENNHKPIRRSALSSCSTAATAAAATSSSGTIDDLRTRMQTIQSSNNGKATSPLPPVVAGSVQSKENTANGSSNSGSNFRYRMSNSRTSTATVGASTRLQSLRSTTSSGANTLSKSATCPSSSSASERLLDKSIDSFRSSRTTADTLTTTILEKPSQSSNPVTRAMNRWSRGSVSQTYALRGSSTARNPRPTVTTSVSMSENDASAASSRSRKLSSLGDTRSVQGTGGSSSGAAGVTTAHHSKANRSSRLYSALRAGASSGFHSVQNLRNAGTRSIQPTPTALETRISTGTTASSVVKPARRHSPGQLPSMPQPISLRSSERPPPAVNTASPQESSDSAMKTLRSAPIPSTSNSSSNSGSNNNSQAYPLWNDVEPTATPIILRPEKTKKRSSLRSPGLDSSVTSKANSDVVETSTPPTTIRPEKSKRSNSLPLRAMGSDSANNAANTNTTDLETSTTKPIIFRPEKSKRIASLRSSGLDSSNHKVNSDVEAAVSPIIIRPKRRTSLQSSGLDSSNHTVHSNSSAQSGSSGASRPATPPVTAHSSRRPSLPSPRSSPRTGGQSSDPVQIEIAPGVKARLRGAKETMECVERDFYLPTNCSFCSLEICCIMDAQYVLCPCCKVISPLNDDVGGGKGGVGLGFTLDDLRRWQSEIVNKRHRR